MPDNLILPAISIKRISRRSVIAACTLGVALLFAALNWANEQGFLNFISGTPATPLVAPAMPGSAPNPALTTEAKANAEANKQLIQPPKAQAQQISQAHADPLVYAGNVGAVTALKAQLQELKLQIELAEQRKRLEKLNQPEPAIVSLPAGGMGEPDLLASLTPPMPSAVLAESKADQRAAPSSVRLVSVQSSGSERSATIITPAGAVTVRQGDPLLNSKVRHVADDAVMLNSGRRITWE